VRFEKSSNIATNPCWWFPIWNFKPKGSSSFDLDLIQHPCGGINTRNRPWNSTLARIEIKILKIKFLNTSLSFLDRKFELFCKVC
jgi:hypothetical protein